MTAFICYFRVSTQAQGRSGLGLEAQREAVARHVASVGGRIAGEFTEVESGKRDDRPQLAAALAACRAQGAVLLVAKLDRLARNARFLLSVVEGAGDAGVCFCDLPQLPPGPAGRFMLTMFAAVAELEAGMISQRTRVALEAAKARGVKLGNPQLKPGTPATAKAASDAASARAKAKARDVMPYVEDAQKAGASTLQQIAQALEARGVRAPRGGTRWAPAQVARVMKAA
ncbi:recombinase family protein [Phenylobacterium sp.]|uniref:recombinase family protein n=1 Tax=Phenylobacterium sp. TaxID=1871053 RepID=UPI0025D92638|nr:recombinase family protein [Phenylobacterium sp.]MCA6268425.1 recombinase family protein [Phenylobacterium sp.]